MPPADRNPVTTEIENLRLEMDKLNLLLLSLIQKRFHLSRMIGGLKATGPGHQDVQRESMMIADLRQAWQGSGENISECEWRAIEKIFRQIIELSRQQQAKHA